MRDGGGGEKKYKHRILVSCQNFIVGDGIFILGDDIFIVGDDIHVYFLWGIHAAVTILLIHGNGCMMNSKLLQQAQLSAVNINNHLLSAKISATGDISSPFYIGYPPGRNKRNIPSSNMCICSKPDTIWP